MSSSGAELATRASLTASVDRSPHLPPVRESYASSQCLGKPFRTQFLGSRDLVSWPAEAPRQLRKLVTIVAFGSTHYHHDVTLLGQIPQGLLPLLGRLADRVDETHVGLWEATAHGGDQLEDGGERLRRLSYDAQPRPAFQLL